MAKRIRIVQSFRRGLIKAEVLVKTSKGQPKYVVKLVRLFKNGDQWQESARFGQKDIPVMRLVLDEAYGWILCNQHEANDAS